MPSNVPEIVPTVFNEMMAKQVFEKIIFPKIKKKKPWLEIESRYLSQTVFL